MLGSSTTQNLVSPMAPTQSSVCCAVDSKAEIIWNRKLWNHKPITYNMKSGEGITTLNCIQKSNTFILMYTPIFGPEHFLKVKLALP